jgi:hypothetical protein
MVQSLRPLARARRIQAPTAPQDRSPAREACNHTCLIVRISTRV